MKKLLFSGVLILILLIFYVSGSIHSEVDSSAKITEEINKLASIKETIIACVPGSNKSAFRDSLEKIFINNNRQPAGELRDGILYLSLEARTGIWYPETHDGSGLRVHAFAEAGKPLQLPGPLIRVPQGTEIRAKVHNSIVGTTLVLRGVYSRPGNPEDSVAVAYGQTYEVQFKTGVAGTYLYWASAGNLKEDAGLPYFDDSQLYGAFIIDSINKKPDPQERIMMIGIWNDTLNGPANNGEELVLNGLTWPYTERLTYLVDHDVHWRVINASNQAHPMHLHGFYYTVNSRGNGDSDMNYEEQYRRRSVTELLQPHETMSMTWIPEKEGNWLFHCHTLVHITPFSFLRKMPDMHQMNNLETHARDGMGGLIMGIHVLASKRGSTKMIKSNERNITLIAQEQPNRFDTLPGKGFVLLEGNVTSASQQISIPGPPIILTRDEPVAIKIINTLHEATTVHWHGLEIESYFDGAAGWGNNLKKLTPLVMPGDSFVAHLTPPRAGTFIYHTHMHDLQLIAGMYGPLIVMEPGQKFDPETNKILLISSGPHLEPPVAMLNGTFNPDTMQLKMGVKYRFRLINITALGPDLKVSFLFKGKPVNWRAIAKDGAYLPPQQVGMMPAAAQQITIGETRDFEFQPRDAGSYSFEVRSGSGTKLFVTMVVQVK